MDWVASDDVVAFPSEAPQVAEGTAPRMRFALATRFHHTENADDEARREFEDGFGALRARIPVNARALQ